MELIIMAGGMGSRFGGLKQVEPVDDDGCFLIDYLIYDAIQVGFNKVIFVVREENFSLIYNTVGKRIEKFVKTSYVFQSNKLIVNNQNLSEIRTKPLGTGHAVLCAEKEISENFAVVNADDFYGKDSFEALAKFLKQNKAQNQFCCVAFELSKTLSPNGSVKRGVCDCQNSQLKQITECSITFLNGNLSAMSLESQLPMAVNDSTPVSMNMFGFTPIVFKYLHQYFDDFLRSSNDLSTQEFFLPSVVEKLIKEKIISVNLLKTSSNWMGLTYKEDLIFVKNQINKLKASGDYPKHLWEQLTKY